MKILYDYALSFLGIPYIFGGSNRSGFDCSGYIQEVLASCGLDPKGDQTAQGLYNYFELNGERNSYTLGALAFFGKSVREISHVAMLLDQYRMIEAGGGDSTTKTVQDALKRNACVRIRLIKNRSDLVAIIKPRYNTIGMV